MHWCPARKTTWKSCISNILTKEIRVATGSLTELRIPIVAFYLIRRYDKGFNSAINYLHNEFNEAMLSGLKENDTLFIREYELRLAAR